MRTLLPNAPAFGAIALAGLLAATAPAQSANDDQPVGEQAVEAVVIGKVVKPGSGTDKVEVPFLLLKDGRAYQEEGASPLDFRPATRPFGSWGVFTWTRTADGFRLTAPNGGTEDLPASGRMAPAADNTRLASVWQASGERAGARWSETIRFSASGSYQLVQSQSMQGAGMMGGGGWQSTGTYRVGGWTLTTEGFGTPPARRLFATNAQGVRMVIGTAIYTIGDGRF